MTLGESADLATGEGSLDTYTDVIDDFQMPYLGVQIPCKTHKKNVTKYCHGCEIFLCDDCLMTAGHDGHVAEVKDAKEKVSLLREVLLNRGSASTDVAELIGPDGEKDKAQVEEQIAVLIKRSDYGEIPILLSLKKRLLKVKTEIQRLSYTVPQKAMPADVSNLNNLENAAIQTDQQYRVSNTGPTNLCIPSNGLVSGAFGPTGDINNDSTAPGSSGEIDGLETADISAGMGTPPRSETPKSMPGGGLDILCKVHRKEMTKYCTKRYVFLCDDCLIPTDHMCRWHDAELMPAAEKFEQIKEVLLGSDNSSTDVWTKKLIHINKYSNMYEDDIAHNGEQDEEKKKARVEEQIGLKRAGYEQMVKLISLKKKLSKVQNEFHKLLRTMTSNT